MKEKLLLHCCCGPCAAHPSKVLKDSFDVLAFFSNSNVEPKEEYQKRLDSFKKLCELTGLEYSVDEYDSDEWFETIKGLELEPERGKRCSICFEYRLKRAFEFAKKNGIKYITTTITVSPYKDSKMVFDVGKKLSQQYGVSFTALDFKKEDGFKKTKELAEKYSLYMQNYCGCVYSLRDKEGRTTK